MTDLSLSTATAHPSHPARAGDGAFFRPDWPRIAGLAYLALAMFGIFAELGARMVVTVHGDPAATLAAIRDNLSMMRWAAIADMGMVLSDVVLAMAFFAIFWRRSPVLAVLLTILALARIPMMGANLVNHLAAVVLASGQEVLPAFSPEMTEQLAYLFLRLHDYAYTLNGINFAAWCIVLGLLVLVTGYAPKIFGLLLLLDGAINSFGTIGALVYPTFMERDWAQLVAGSAYGELVFILFLVIAPGYMRRRIEADTA